MIAEIPCKGKHFPKLKMYRIIYWNLSLNVENVIEWCKEKISLSYAEITRKGKNWYITIDNCIITVNAYSYTVITAHKVK